MTVKGSYFYVLHVPASFTALNYGCVRECMWGWEFLHKCIAEVIIGVIGAQITVCGGCAGCLA